MVMTLKRMMMMKVLLLMVLLVTKARLGQSDWGTRESEGGSVGGGEVSQLGILLPSSIHDPHLWSDIIEEKTPISPLFIP